MKYLLSFFFSLLAAGFLMTVFATQSWSDELDDINKQINDLNASLNMSIKATQPLESELNKLREQITNIKNKVTQIEVDVSIKKKNIDQGYKDLEKQTAILNRTIRDFYIRSYYDSPLVTILSTKSAGDITQILAYQKAAADQDKAIITNIALSISDLEEKKKNLENEQQRLATLKVTLDEQSAKLDKVVAGAKAYQSTLSSKIAQLSAQQQALIAAKQASLGIPISAYSGQGSRCIDDRGIDPGFSPALAFFTYGVPNRVGLNQYGAWGRAKAGENAEQILQDYYPGLTLKKDYDRGASINVNGYGTFNVEDYTKHIYEMPATWTDNDSAALKAQAVAARSYGLAHRGGICTTESCQVFKPDPKTDNGNAWISAVDQTAGWVLVDGGGNPVSTQYSSTHGGYIINLNKFDGTGSVNSFSDLQNNAFDGPKHANSPWFYCDWGARGDKKTAWLRPEEVADIVNVILLARRDSSLGEHFYQTDNPPGGKDVWSADRVKSELSARGGTPFNNVSDVSVSADFGAGKLNNITLSGDGRSETFSGQEFKDWFNLRAPANIQIVGPLYNVERK